MHETELVFKRHCLNKRMKLDHDAVSASGPFMSKSHEVTKAYSESPFRGDLKNGMVIEFSCRNDGEN